MTKRDPTPCAWCRRPVATFAATGRPRRYCGQACRQRAYEARRHARQLGLDANCVLVRQEDLSRLHDLLYQLEAAVEDVDLDLSEDRSAKALRHAFDHLREAAGGLRGVVVVPLAGEKTTAPLVRFNLT